MFVSLLFKDSNILKGCITSSIMLFYGLSCSKSKPFINKKLNVLAFNSAIILSLTISALTAEKEYRTNSRFKI